MFVEYQGDDIANMMLDSRHCELDFKIILTDISQTVVKLLGIISNERLSQLSEGGFPLVRLLSRDHAASCLGMRSMFQTLRFPSHSDRATVFGSWIDFNFIVTRKAEPIKFALIMQ